MAVSPTYTTQTKIERRISSTGVSLRIDDDANSLTSTIEDATTEVNGYCQLLYTTTALAASEWIAMKTTDIALYFLCMRRANPVPHSVQVRYDKAIADLEKVHSGVWLVPDAPTRQAAVPTLSNQRVRLQPIPRTVTEMGRSTGTQEGYKPFNDPIDTNYVI